MKLDPNAVIAGEKLLDYLLRPRVRNDKSRFLARAGYTQANWQSLQIDLREQVLLRLEADFSRPSRYGDLYTIHAALRGPNGVELQILSVWIVDRVSSQTRLNHAIPCIGRDLMFDLYSEVALARDIPSEDLKRGDVATVVDHFPSADGEDGYALEVFNAVGDTLKVVVVPGSALKALSEEDVWAVRALS